MDLEPIVIESDLGKLTWTPPPALQQKLAMAPEFVRQSARQWMQNMLEGYLSVLLDCQRTGAGIEWLSDRTKALAIDAITIDFQPKTPPVNPSAVTH